MELTELYDIGQFEEEIVDRLDPIVSSNTSVSPIPENADFRLPIGDKISVYVSAAESRFDPSLVTSSSNQDEDVTISILVMGSRLRGSSGIYPIVARVRALMIGWHSSHSTKGIDLIGGGFVEPEERDLNVFRYMLRFKASLMLSPIDQEEAPVLITQITHISSITNEATITRDDSIDGGTPSSVYDESIDGGPTSWPY